MTDLLKEFQQYLKSRKLSQKSIKNYVSDVRHFLKWTAKNNLKDFTSTLFSTYKSHLINNKTPIKSINRYLSSLRRFGLFLKQEKLMPFNPTKNLMNIRETKGPAPSRPVLPLIDKFKGSLEQQGLKPATIKNYVSDVNQFLDWLNR